MKDLDKIKKAFIIVFTAIWSKVGIVAIPWIILLVCNVLDYYTALKAVPNRNEKVESAISMHGIKKKLIMHLLIILGFFIDVLIAYTCSYTGIVLPFTFVFAIVIALWLCFNEIISILENISDILGEENIPPFLLPAMRLIKGSIETKSELKESEEK